MQIIRVRVAILTSWILMTLCRASCVRMLLLHKYSISSACCNFVTFSAIKRFLIGGKKPYQEPRHERLYLTITHVLFSQFTMRLIFWNGGSSAKHYWNRGSTMISTFSVEGIRKMCPNWLMVSLCQNFSHKSKTPNVRKYRRKVSIRDTLLGGTERQIK